MQHDWSGLWDNLKSHMGRGVEQVKGHIPIAAQAVEAYANPMSIIRTLSVPAKRDLIAAFSNHVKGSGKRTSAINMGYGKRRNNRSKRPAKRNNKSRKRRSGRASKKSKASSNMMSAIHKALSGRI